MEISNYGRLRNKKNQKIYKTQIQKSGYVGVVISLGMRGKCKMLKLHRCVASTFLENPSGKKYINHIDANKTNNHIDNLEWCTASENIKHAIRNGVLKSPSGSESVNAKLTEQDVFWILSNYVPRDSNYGVRAIARKYKIGHRTISDIIHRRAYKNECHNYDLHNSKSA